MSDHGVISLKDHIKQVGLLEQAKIELTEQLEEMTSNHEAAVNRAIELQSKLNEANSELTQAREELATEKAALEEAKKLHAEELKKRDEAHTEAVKQGVIDALAEQGREPVNLQNPPAKTVYKADDVALMTPFDRAEVMRKVRKGEAKLS